MKKIDLQGEVGFTHQTNRLAAGVGELMPGIERRSKHGSSSESNDTLLVLIGLPEVSFSFSPNFLLLAVNCLNRKNQMYRASQTPLSYQIDFHLFGWPGSEKDLLFTAC